MCRIKAPPLPPGEVVAVITILERMPRPWQPQQPRFDNLSHNVSQRWGVVKSREEAWHRALGRGTEGVFWTLTFKAVTEKEPGQGREQSSVVWLIIISNLVPQRSLKKSLLLEVGSQELAGCSCSRCNLAIGNNWLYLDWIGSLPRGPAILGIRGRL